MNQHQDDFYYRDAYATRRNRTIAIKREIITITFFVAVWGLVWLCL